MSGKDDEIRIPFPDVGENGPSIPPSAHQRRLDIFKSWTNIIATTAALVTAVGAFMKPNDPVNKSAYTELKNAVELNSKLDQQNHDDVVSLRNYLDGYAKALDSNQMSNAPADAGVPMDASDAIGKPAGLAMLTVRKGSPKTPVKILVPNGLQAALIASASTSDGGAGVLAVLPATPPQLPDIRPAPAPQSLPNYDQLAK